MGLASDSLLSALTLGLYSPVAAYNAAIALQNAVNPNTGLAGLPTTVGGYLWSGSTGSVDAVTKNAAIKAEASNLVQASGGTLSIDDATAQATSDITAALVQAGADPSQAQIPWGTILVLAAIVYLTIRVIE